MNTRGSPGPATFQEVSPRASRGGGGGGGVEEDFLARLLKPATQVGKCGVVVGAKRGTSTEQNRDWVRVVTETRRAQKYAKIDAPGKGRESGCCSSRWEGGMKKGR